MSIRSCSGKRSSPPGLVHKNRKVTTVISKKAIALCAAAGVAVSGFALVTPANADPVAESYSIVGSDTLEDVVGALIQGTSITGAPVRSLVNNAASGSFDATGTPYIIAKSSGKRFGRPNGSGDGRKALKASINGTDSFQASAQIVPAAGNDTYTLAQVAGTTIPGEVDLSRASSSGTVAADSGIMVQIPFGRDALGYVYDSGSACADLADLTTAELKTIFEGGDVTKCGTIVRAVTPQVGSGTGKDWAAKIGATTANITASVTNKINAWGQEHDATTLGTFTVMPMSVSRWIAMNTGASYPKKKATTVLGAIGGVSPVTGSGASMEPNATYYNGSYGRDTYIVAEYARVTSGDPKFDQNLADLLDPTKSTSLTNTQTSSASKAGSVKKKFGFLAPSTTDRVRISG
jgi:hypothetical protein